MAARIGYEFPCEFVPVRFVSINPVLGTIDECPCLETEDDVGPDLTDTGGEDRRCKPSEGGRTPLRRRSSIELAISGFSNIFPATNTSRRSSYQDGLTEDGGEGLLEHLRSFERNETVTVDDNENEIHCEGNMYCQETTNGAIDLCCEIDISAYIDNLTTVSPAMPINQGRLHSRVFRRGSNPQSRGAPVKIIESIKYGGNTKCLHYNDSYVRSSAYNFWLNSNPYSYTFSDNVVDVGDVFSVYDIEDVGPLGTAIVESVDSPQNETSTDVLRSGQVIRTIQISVTCHVVLDIDSEDGLKTLIGQRQMLIPVIGSAVFEIYPLTKMERLTAIIDVLLPIVGQCKLLPIDDD